MPTTLPVPIEFDLPEGWRAAPPDDVGAPGAAFVALHPHPDDGFTANVTIDGAFRPDEATLSEIADESVGRLRQVSTSVEVRNRRDFASPDAPGFAQRLAVTTVVNGVSRDLGQAQVYLGLLDVDDPCKRAVIRLVLTATASQLPSVLEDFQSFVRTVRTGTSTPS